MKTVSLGVKEVIGWFGIPGEKKLGKAVFRAIVMLGALRYSATRRVS